ncbi:MAG: glycoside hydrolase family 15 protein [Planctomycetota bacterium]|nr:glycoside hydrolase family 15 protein [Planctomycetaceae bacterium]MDQ3329083.1 glycoside hydrolase family 15 protein [Planctomycetota bacterium]
MAYQPIENYGVIGNLRTAALVGMDGSIDWLCLPRFDSPSVFGAILDDKIGGRFQIAPADRHDRRKQFYWPDTNILITRFLDPDGLGEIEDYMPIGVAARAVDQLVRRVRVVRGTMKFRMDCRPAFDYARQRHETSLEDNRACFESRDLTLGLATTVPLRRDGDSVHAEFVLKEGDQAVFVLRVVDRDGPKGPAGAGPCPKPEEAERLFRTTADAWQRWLSKCTYHGRWRETVCRSALALKLMTYEPTGAIVAAPTCSLPEGIGGVRNWDYRYTWIRDAAFTLYALMRIGFTEEAAGFMEFLSNRARRSAKDSDHPLRLMYRVDGSTDVAEEELGHLDGYRGSKPVRIGNGALDQLQLDIYGELMDAAYLYNKHGSPLSFDTWSDLRSLANWVCENWQRPDEGIWEVRGGRQQMVFSKVLCWVAIDRALRLADKRSFPCDRPWWLATRDSIYETVMREGWDRGLNSFTQTLGGNQLDASMLLMPLVFFMAPNDPRMLATLKAIRRPTREGGLSADGLVYRYDPKLAPDGLPGTEGTFNMCSFWLVESLTRAGRTEPGLLDEARLLFEQMLGYSNHLGLYAEQTGLSGEALGNFPQALTHLGLISAAFNLDRALSGGKPGM